MIALLTLVWVFNVMSVVVLIFSSVFHSAVHMTERQLPFSGGAAWLTDTIAVRSRFPGTGLRWSGRPRLATARRKPLPVPQDENVQLARRVGARLWDYSYASLTNATAFSPTDAMPLTRAAKALIAAESTLSAITVVLVASRAVNILS